MHAIYMQQVMRLMLPQLALASKPHTPCNIYMHKPWRPGLQSFSSRQL